MLPPSLEALEDLALRARAVQITLVRATLDGRPEPLHAPIDAARFARAYGIARVTDPALGVLLAETVVFEALRRPARAYQTARAEHPIVLPGEPPVPTRSLVPLLALEANEHRRAALGRAADALAKDL